MFSDGVLELLGEGDLIEKEAALRDCIAASGSSDEAIIDAIGVARFKELPDDVAALFVRGGELDG
jgi:hypothetical protein